MGLFSKDNRAAYRLGGVWERLWEAPDAAAPPVTGMRAVDAFQRLGDLANLGGATSGDALVIAIEVVSAVDRHRSYPDAMVDLRRFYERGDLRSVRDEPMDRVLPWPAVVEIAEAAARLARTYKVDGWRNELIAAVGRGEEVDLTPLVAFAPHSALEAYSGWERMLRDAESMDAAERETYEDFEGSLIHTRRVVEAFAKHFA